jgi:hypothetical protein
MSIEEQLKPIIEKAIAAAEATGEFVVEQAPILLQEFYAWHAVESIFWAIFGLCLTIIPTLIMRKIADKEEEDRWSINYFGKRIDNELAIGLYFASALSFLLGIPMLVVNLLDFIKILVAPRLYIIEYFLAQ